MKLSQWCSATFLPFVAPIQFAVSLTKDEGSISIVDRPGGDGYELVALFRMPTMARYKVVDEIARIFKMANWDFEDYVTMTISFPKW